MVTLHANMQPLYLNIIYLWIEYIFAADGRRLCTNHKQLNVGTAIKDNETNTNYNISDLFGSR